MAAASGMRRRGAALAAMALAVVAAGCWGQPSAGPAHTRNNAVETALNAGNVAALEEAWSVPTGEWAYEPVVEGGRLVVSEDRRPNDGPLRVEAFSPATGALLWDRELVAGGQQPIVTPVAYSGDALLVGYGITGNSWPPPATCPSGIEKLDAATGAQLAFVPGRVPVSAPVTSGDTVAVVTEPIGADCVRGQTRRLEVRDRATLALQYSYEAPSGESLGARPSFAGNRIVLGSGAKLLAFPAAGCGAATCAPVWTATAPGIPGQLETTFGGVMVSGGLVFARTGYVWATPPVPTFGSEVRVFDPATGGLLGVRDLGSGAGDLAARGSTLYFTRQPGGATSVVELRAIAFCGTCAERFEDLWSTSIEASHFTAGATIGGDVVYVGAYTPDGGVVVAVDADGCGAPTCAPLATVPLTGSATDLSVSGGRVFAAKTLGNGNYALTALTVPAS